MANMPHSSALDGLIVVIVKKAVNQLRPSSIPISLPDSEHNRALINAGYFAIVQEAPEDSSPAAEEFAPEPADEEHDDYVDDDYELEY